MTIKKRKPSSSRINRLNTRFREIKKVENRKSTKSIIKMIIYIFLFFIIIWFLLLIVVYNKYFRPLSVEDLKNLQIAESSILYDRNWKELYKIYTENRTYVDYKDISKNIVNWLVAWEDQRYWENPWVDFIWLIRAWIKSIVWWDKISWTSTLTQQLIRNTIIANRSSKETLADWIDRKFKEIFLSYQLTKSLSKEKILELYLNKIEFWHNAFGIEEASKTFFNKKAKDVNVFEWSVLASLPKWPTYYSPYNHQDRLVWYIKLTDKDSKKENWKTDFKKLVTAEEVESEKKLVEILKEKISALKWKWINWSDKYIICNVENKLLSTNEFSVDDKGCVLLEYSRLLNFMSDIKIENEEKILTYYPWRKDYILQRMLEDKYINFDEYKAAILQWFGFKFNTKKEKITAPHFVFYAKEYLENKYGKESISMWGLKIYTTLDLDLQNQADAIVKEKIWEFSRTLNVNNSWLVSIDNKTGGILAMVWNVDYYSDDWKWQVNVMTSKLQPGSTFKPFVYSLAMYQNELWPKTPVYDVKTDFGGGYVPKNFDGKFMWKITLSTALNNSRNIPAIKMFYMTSWVNDIIKFMNKLWATSLTKEEDYWASLALWTWRLTWLDLAKAYSVFANMWEKIEINPILKIVDSKWNVIEDNSKPKKEQVMTTGQAFLLNSILSDSSTRPSTWNRFLDIGRPAAVKTWTSTKPVKERGETIQYPANLWTAWYTPQFTTVVWSWNADWKTLKYKADWLTVSWPIWKEFMKILHKWKEVQDWQKPKDVKKVTISEISWLLPNPNYPNSFLVSSYFINPPKKIDDSYKEIVYDALCNWKVTDQTPESAIKRYVYFKMHSLKPDKPSWEEPVQEWIRSSGIMQKYWYTWEWLPTIKDEVCNRIGGTWDISIKSNLSSNWKYSIWWNPIEIAYNSSSEISKIEILINNELIQSIPINDFSWSLRQNFIIPEKFWNSKIKVEIRALNNEYFSNSEIKEILVWLKNWNTQENNYPWNAETNLEEKNQPNNNQTSNIEINITNPKSSSIRINSEDYFNLRFSTTANNLSNVNLILDWSIYENLWNSWNYVVPINLNQKLKKWINNLKIQVIDLNWATKEKSIQVEIL